MLIYLAVDLCRDPALLRRFEESPREVLEEYKVGEDTVRELQAGGREKVEAYLASEVSRILDRLSVPHPVILWGGISLNVTGCSPDHHDLGTVSFTISAEGLAPDAKLGFTGPAEVVGQVERVINPGLANGILIATATFAVEGIYSAVVENPDPDQKDRFEVSMLPNCFKATS